MDDKTTGPSFGSLDESREAAERFRDGVTYETDVTPDEPIPADPDPDGEEDG